MTSASYQFFDPISFSVTDPTTRWTVGRRTDRFSGLNQPRYTVMRELAMHCLLHAVLREMVFGKRKHATACYLSSKCKVFQDTNSLVVSIHDLFDFNLQLLYLLYNIHTVAVQYTVY